MAASSEPRSPARAERRGGIGNARRLVTVAAVALLAGAVGFALLRSTEDPGDRALRHAHALVADDDNFVTAIETGVTFTKVSTDLERAADDCKPERAPRCENLDAAAGYARVSAVGVLRCTRPGVFDARRAMRGLLVELQHGGEDDTREADIPSVVSCR